MRKVIALGILASLLPTLAMARGNHPMAGCGLGYLLLSNQDNDKVKQVLGSTTNGTFGSQTFGISSGTSGCTEDGAVKLARATEVFADVNLATLRQDIAAGQGEYVDAFATLLGSSEQSRGHMVNFLKSEYQNLFPTAETTSTDMLNTLAQKLAQHPELIG